MPGVVRLTNVVQAYDWGSSTAIPALLGIEPSGEPQAELWMGAHPKGPSRVEGSSLGDLIAADTAGTVGPGRESLPFLLKVLAAAAPLSLQAHPSIEQAAEGFAREDAAGIPIDAPHRNYRDANHKPELICPLGPFSALCGFRDPLRTRALLTSLEVPRLAPVIDRLDDLAAAVRYLLELPSPEALVAAVADACGRPSPSFALERGWAVRLAEAYPGDGGVVLALLLNCVELAAGEAVELPAGNLHAYLAGVGVEIMASSDNVLRGGLTSKHVDTAELLAVLDTTPMEVAPLLPRPVAPGVEVWDSVAPDFRLSRLRPAGGSIMIEPHGPEILLVTEGSVRVAELTLDQGQSAFVPAATGRYEVGGTGTAYRATVG